MYPVNKLKSTGMLAIFPHINAFKNILLGSRLKNEVIFNKICFLM